MEIPREGGERHAYSSVLQNISSTDLTAGNAFGLQFG
jgi:hypothetical protein